MKKVVSPEKHLASRDRQLAKLIGILGGRRTSQRMRTPFDALMKAIISQQLSSSASGSICKRIEVHHGKRPFKAAKIVRLGGEAIRSCGVSTSKVKAILGIADACLNGEISKRKLNRLGDDEVLKILTSYWGIGTWTAEIFMMFCLGRQDVLARNDAGLIRSHRLLYPEADSLEETSENWRPYRAVAAWYLWQFIDSPEIHKIVIGKD